MLRTLDPLRALLATAALLAAGCTDHDRTPSSLGPGAQQGDVSVDVLLRTTARADLRAFSAVLAAVELVRADGSTGENLLAAPLERELAHLDDEAAWLARARVAPLEFAAVRVTFVPGTYRAVAQDGTPVPVDAVSDVLVAELPVPYSLLGTSYARFVVDLDLRESLRGSVADGFVLDPEGLTLFGTGTQPVAVDEIVGLVTDRDTGTQTIELAAFADQALAVPIGGTVPVLLLDDALGITAGNFVIDLVPYFLTYLSPGATLVEVDGVLGAGGILVATRVEIEDQVAPLGQNFPVQLAGRVVRVLDPVYRFEIELTRIERGADLVEPVSATLGDPGSVEVFVEPFTTLVYAGGAVLQVTAIAVGQSVELALPAFSGEPLRPSRVEIDRGPRFTGVVSDVTGLPASLRMQLPASTLAVRAGLVASATTAVTVRLGGSTILLDTSTELRLVPADLLAGLTIEVDGELSGPPAAPVVDAELVRVVPGRLEGATVASVVEAPDGFDTLDGAITATFGGGLDPGPAGPLTFTVGADTLFRGAAGSFASFVELFATLEPGATLTVDVAGLATDAMGILRAADVLVTR